MQNIEIQLEDEAFQEITLSANDALRTVVEQLAEEKGESGSVTIKITLEKNSFADGYKKLRNGLNINYKVDSTVTNKTSQSNSIITANMMLTESDYLGYVLVPAPDPQQRIDEYLEA